VLLQVFYCLDAVLDVPFPVAPVGIADIRKQFPAALKMFILAVVAVQGWFLSLLGYLIS